MTPREIIALDIQGPVAAKRHGGPGPIALLRAGKILANMQRLGLTVTSGWQPIETAPRDGTHFLAYEPTGDMYRAAYHSHGYVMAFGGQPVVNPPEPTHWMPVPASPAPDEAEAEARGG